MIEIAWLTAIATPTFLVSGSFIDLHVVALIDPSVCRVPLTSTFVPFVTRPQELLPNFVDALVVTRVECL